MESNLLDDNGTKNAKPDRKVDSLCPYCGVGCQLTYNIQDEKIISVDGRDGPANKNRLCVKGRFGFDYIHNPERLKVPLIRKSNKPKNPNEKLDPLNPFTHFREASWDEALDLAAGKLKDILDKSGDKSLAGFGCAKGSNEEAYLFQKLIRTGFKSRILSRSVNGNYRFWSCHSTSIRN